MAIKRAIEEFRPDERLVDERGPTLERIQHAWGNIDVGSSDGRMTIRQNAIERGLRRKVFNAKQGRAAEKFYLHWYRSGLGAEIGSPDIFRIFGNDGQFLAGPKTEDQMFHRQMLRRARDIVLRKTNEAGHDGADCNAVLELIVCKDATLEQAGMKIGYASRDKAIAMAEMLAKGGLNILAAEWGL